MKKYDALIIGSGQAASPLATKLAAKGWEVALVEKEHIGGTCINEGCTPTKTMVASAKNAFQARRAKEYGLTTGNVQIDMQAIINRKKGVVDRFRNGLQQSLEKQEHIDLLWGEAFFTGNKQIAVTGKDGKTQSYTAGHIFINTGARPAIPPIPGIDGVPYLTSTTIMELQTVPEHLVIVGAGYVSIEFAQMFRRFGSNVTILNRSTGLLAREDTDVSDGLQSILEEEGINIIRNINVEAVSKDTGGIITLTTNDNAHRTITASHVLIATGRRANTDKLQLEKTGVETDKNGYIKVNEKLETTVPGIYALGDVKGGPAFTHISYNDYLVVYKNIIEQQNVTINNRPVPYCVFMDPEMGRVGLNETEAKEQQLPYKVAKLPMNYVARATEAGEPKGFMKAIVHAQTDKILGVVVIGAGGGELMSLLQIAMLGGVTASQLAENIFAHPTYAESINNLFNTIA
ncbi:dihydrolipoyl dehydrogenase [Niastella koreensis]|uniref:Dihydrolipoyl dehydrogenase n=2 Tax=Niastella koreensis TaxID=354356 RepID=G8TEP2_NIAKG|nr:dihydrolipoyl dehydrogenase [Niastella koreensis]AEW00478.1 Dihydrolipoyl dehydrogenase [Niastella koreensis GR20-10]OQP52339.1 dihydrolipoyl dehydrogenase [Niastella koreensis]